jgi:hypothetical protein
MGSIDEWTVLHYSLPELAALALKFGARTWRLVAMCLGFGILLFQHDLRRTLGRDKLLIGFIM